MDKGYIDLSLSGGSSRVRSVPVRYANVTFRSKLEARWALFFDLLGVPWEYEPQGFVIEVRKLSVIGNGSYVRGSFAYLPDFRITYDGEGDYWWLEVKGRPPTKHELYKCDMLAKGLKQAVILVSGGFSHTPKSFIYTTCTDQPTDIVWRWLNGFRRTVTADEVAGITRAYRQVSGTHFERTKRRPRRRKGHLRRLVVGLDA